MKAQLRYLFIFTVAHISYAQHTFIIKEGSEKYNAILNVENCNSDNCEGKATIKIFDKKEKAFSQTLASADLYFYLDSIQKPSVNVIQLYNEQSPLIFEDFNFDGTEDLAIRNGNHSSYGSPSYDVYVYHSTKNKFVISDELTKLAVENLGMFQTDSKRKRLITFAKSGCCWHLKTEYEIVPQKGLLKVYEFVEDATVQGGDYVIVTTRKLVNNKWIEKSEKHLIEEYYKD